MPAGLDNPVHILIVLLVVLVLFGAKRLPELGRSLGSSMREFKDSVQGKDTDALTPTSGSATSATADSTSREQLSS
jgi:sec-independent protein translocase protein TatA